MDGENGHIHSLEGDVIVYAHKDTLYVEVTAPLGFYVGPPRLVRNGYEPLDLKQFEANAVPMPELASGDKQPFQQKTFTLHDEQAEDVDAAVAKAKQMGHGESGVNENSNGNALAFVCQSFNRANP